MARDRSLALSFGTNVTDYERGRPGYPDAAVEWMLAQATPGSSPSDTEPAPAPAAATTGSFPSETEPASASAAAAAPNGSPRPDIEPSRTSSAPGGTAPSPLRVVDVGAGTGKFTASLVARGLDVTAVEPDDVMRAGLERNFGTVTAVRGTGESMPLPDGSADLVTFAQSWHWVDVERASREVARVLAPAGAVALVWNIRDQSVDWVRRLGEIMGSSAAEDYDTLTPSLGAPLETVEHAQFFWDNPMTREQLLAMVSSRSYIIALEPDERTALLGRIERLLDEHPQLAAHDTYVMPYETRVTLARRPAALS
ncbi:class I SAM-dependent methyltransferase [Subtercola sp. YIM 133946]|uniref:class I SAM-dependent methyltransferase n=1 Tax=Subtercola sp. YIM 133946 TaxID=3118909 RepID=UPI002F9531A6